VNLGDIREHHEEVEEEVSDRLEDFRDLRDASEYRWFMELCFVICSSQTEGKKAWEAVEELDDKNLLAEGNTSQISKVLASHGVSYEDNKAEYIVSNREELSQPTLSNPTRELRLKDRLNLEDHGKAREWLAEEMKGVGMKGASHFLRNVGYGSDFAILSGHILSTMSELGYLDDASPPEGAEEYLKKEENLLQLSERLGIDLGALDLVLWSYRTGEVFK
jgi:N-glycosylase/DNA lyase